MVRIAFIYLLICIIYSFHVYANIDFINIYDKSSLANAKTIIFTSFDTLTDFNGRHPQAYYTNRFSSLLSMGLNGYTNYEVIDKNSKLKPDLIFKFRFLKMFYSDENTDKDSVGEYKTICTIEILAYNSQTRTIVFQLKDTKISHFYRHKDELLDNVLEIADNFIQYFKSIQPKPFTKSFYCNNIKCSDLTNSSISYLFLNFNKEDLAFKKFYDVVEAELQKYFYENKIMILKLEKKLDSLIYTEKNSITFNNKSNVLNPIISDIFKKSKIDYLLLINNLTSFESDFLPSNYSINFPFVYYNPFNMSISIGMGESSANTSSMNSFNRIFCNVILIDLKQNISLLNTMLFVIEDDECDDPEIDICPKIVDQISGKIKSCFRKRRH